MNGSAIRNNDIWFEGKWMQLEDLMLSEVSQAQKDKGCKFSLKHDHIQTQMQNMSVTVELLWNSGKEGK
jgi:hypothetical protein